MRQRYSAAYSAVVTTGIYCRPGCPGQPRGENVETYVFPAAAEARGFRPCLRCRPDTGPAPSPWLSPSELVCRALHLIAAGALDEGATADLAQRLGVSDRHLRRLFDAHVGASPDVVARSRRAHFARRLLIDTDLPVSDVAHAAGFGSVRQFNRTMKEVFRFTPLELRSRRRSTDLQSGTSELELRLPYRPPLAVDAMLGFLADRAIPGVEEVVDGVYRRVVAAPGGPAVVELQPGRDHGELRLRVDTSDVAGLIHVVHAARRVFDLDADSESIDRDLGSDPVLAPLVAECPGLRVPATWDTFEAGVRAIVGQQVSVAGARRTLARLVEAIGTPVAPRGPRAAGLTRLFPTPHEMATADLVGLGVTRARAGALRKLADAVAAGALDLDGAPCLDSLVDRLVAVPGIGPWTAQIVAMRGAGERDAFPAADLGVRRGLTAIGAAPDHGDRWRPWRAYAVMHLWRAASAARPQLSEPRRPPTKSVTSVTTG